MTVEFKLDALSLASNDGDTIDLYVRVIRTNSWPMPSTITTARVPSAAHNAYESFVRFYHTKHSGRHLRLLPQHGSADILATFYGCAADVSKKPSEGWANTQEGATLAKVVGEAGMGGMLEGCDGTKNKSRQHILQVSTHQMIVLMLFNVKETWTYEEILHETDIPARDLVRVIQPLTLGKQHRVLVKHAATTKDKEIGDNFTVNDQFTSKLYRITIKPVVANKEEDKKECDDARHQVNEERKLELDAAVVRIMKARRRLDHNALVTEVTQQLMTRFVPSGSLVKQRVQSLIEREYIERAADDRQCYTYVA